MFTSNFALKAAAALALVGAATLPTLGRAAGQGVAEPQPILSDAGTDFGSPALSFTGRYVAYYAASREQPSRPLQLRRLDLANGRSELLNRSVDGGVAAGNNSMPPVISGDGTRVAFSSTASRLVANDTNGVNDAFVRDAATDTTLLASVAFDGEAANGATGMTSLSKNGRYAVFTSRATDVVPGSTTTNTDVYRRDLTGGTTTQVTVKPDGSPSRGPGSTSADVSASGNLVAFNSYDADITFTDDADEDSDLYLRNMTTGRTRWLSEGVPAGANPDGVVISPNGRWVSSRWADGSLHLTSVHSGVTSTVVPEGYALHGAFSSRLGRFVFIAAGRPYVRDLCRGVDTPISVPDGGFAVTVTISGNGQYAAYDWNPDDGGPAIVYRVAL
jgi:Tol biopolymer transport system component